MEYLQCLNIFLRSEKLSQEEGGVIQFRDLSGSKFYIVILRILKILLSKIFKIYFMQQTINRKWAILLGILLAGPTAYFILISLLKYALGSPYLFDSAQPLLERLGIKESLGFNINLLILPGPLIAMILNLLAVLKIDWYNQQEMFTVKLSIQKHWWNMVLVIFSGLILVTLFIYALGENCRC